MLRQALLSALLLMMLGACGGTSYTNNPYSAQLHLTLHNVGCRVRLAAEGEAEFVTKSVDVKTVRKVGNVYAITSYCNPERGETADEDAAQLQEYLGMREYGRPGWVPSGLAPPLEQRLPHVNGPPAEREECAPYCGAAARGHHRKVFK